MRISVFGLGYVGSVTAACFADWGHDVTGVDPCMDKVDAVNGGRAPVIEPELEHLIRKMRSCGKLGATPDAERAVLQSDISFICVGTPGRTDGNLDYNHLEQASHDIGTALAKKNDFHIVTVRSTALPGTLRDIVVPALEKQAGRKAGDGFGVCHNPEFLREGSAIADFNRPARTVIGATDKRSGDAVEAIYNALSAPVIRCPVEVAEMVKYADNAWHAAKVAFANEIGAFCKAEGIDGHQVMDIFCRDTKLNISPAYLRPGFAFGGSCLPKDIHALTAKARRRNIAMPLLNALLSSNEAHIRYGIEMILATGKKKIGLLGLSFKAKTGDVRSSPLVEVARRLIEKDCDLRIHDKNVRFIPDLQRFMTDSIEDILAHADVIVIGNNAPEFAQIAAWLRPEQQVIDFVRIRPVEQAHASYNGICW